MAREDVGKCCRSPQQEFTIRNDGNEPLANDTRTTITLPKGVISRQGLTEIVDYLQCHSLISVSCMVHVVGDEWQTPKGNFAKRLSHYAYQAGKEKIPAEVLAQVGYIARDHSKPVNFAIDVTRRLNLRPGDFGNPGSCWWDSYSYSRCALKTNGGFGLRTFDEYGEVSGRAWVMPLRLTKHDQLVPTFDALTPDAFVAFNGYGALGGYAAPRVLAHLADWAYRKIAFTCSPMYVNSNAGYLIAPEEITKHYASRELRPSVEQHADLFSVEQAALAELAKERKKAEKEAEKEAAKKNKKTEKTGQ